VVLPDGSEREQGRLRKLDNDNLRAREQSFDQRFVELRLEGMQVLGDNQAKAHDGYPNGPICTMDLKRVPKQHHLFERSYVPNTRAA
jgi:hypothetical protein